MTEKLLTFPSPTPPPPLLPPETLGMGSIGQTSFLSQNSINTNQQRHMYRDMHGSRTFLSGGGGGGVQAPQLILQYIYRGCPMVLLHIFQGVQLFPGTGVQMLISIETHITITCDFPGDPLSSLLDPHMGNVEFWHESVRHPFKLKNSKC